jgi:hypothetical protein
MSVLLEEEEEEEDNFQNSEKHKRKIFFVHKMPNEIKTENTGLYAKR